MGLCKSSNVSIFTFINASDLKFYLNNCIISLDVVVPPLFRGENHLVYQSDRLSGKRMTA